MPRNLEKCDNNEYRFHDPRTGEEVVFYYRSPATEDRVRHQTRRYGKKDGKLVVRTRSACIESAAEVLTGIRDGDFIIGTEPLSSTPENPGYREDWKEHVVDMAGDLLLIMGHDLFEQKISMEVLKELEVIAEFEPAAIGAEIEDAVTETVPLPKSSGASKTPARRSEKRSVKKGAARP